MASCSGGKVLCSLDAELVDVLAVLGFSHVVRGTWKSVYNSSDANESLTRFLHTFNRISNNHAPIKSIKIKGKSNKPWITKGLKKSTKVRNQLYKNWLTTRNSYYYNRYKMYPNKIVTINKLYRTIYYNRVLKDSTNSKKMWDNINLIINKKRPSSIIDNLQVNGKKSPPTSFYIKCYQQVLLQFSN